MCPKTSSFHFFQVVNILRVILFLIRSFNTKIDNSNYLGTDNISSPFIDYGVSSTFIDPDLHTHHTDTEGLWWVWEQQAQSLLSIFCSLIYVSLCCS